MRRVEGVRAVTYDCWGTLLRDHDWEGAMEIRLGALLRFLDISEDEGRDLIEEAWRHHDDAWKQIETFGPGRMAAFCLEARGIDDDDKISELTQEFENASLQAGVDAVEGAKETLVRLEKEGIALGLVCDTGFTSGRVVRELHERNDQIQHLQVLCFSDEVGVPKPDPDIFAKALAQLGVRPYEAAHVGDLRRTDIAGARELGMLPVRFRGVHDDRSDFRDADCIIDRHEQILECINLA
jgi:putative hydrolase of the HAD superfamily